MISIFVTVRIKSGFREQFIEASYGDAQGSVRDEPGCFRFDMLQDAGDPDLFHRYEVYQDQSAIDAHRAAPHYLKWRETVWGWLDGDPQRVEMTTLFPSEEGWRKQKAGLLNW